MESKSSEKKEKIYSNGIKNKSTQKKHLNLRLKKHLKIYDNDSTTVSDMSNEQKQKLINKLQLYNVNVLKDVIKAIVLRFDDDRLRSMSKRHVIAVIAEQININPFKTQTSINRVLNPVSFQSKKNIQKKYYSSKNKAAEQEEEEEEDDDDYFNDIELEEGIKNNEEQEQEEKLEKIEEEENNSTDDIFVNVFEDDDNEQTTVDDTDNEHKELSGFMNIFEFGKNRKCYYYATK